MRLLLAHLPDPGGLLPATGKFDKVILLLSDCSALPASLLELGCIELHCVVVWFVEYAMDIASQNFLSSYVSDSTSVIYQV